MTLKQVKQAQGRYDAAARGKTEARQKLRNTVTEAHRAKRQCVKCKGSGKVRAPTNPKTIWRCDICHGTGSLRGHTMQEIGEVLGMTRQGVYDLVKR